MKNCSDVILDSDASPTFCVSADGKNIELSQISNAKA